MRFIDMFSGIGGFHQGMERAGHKCVGFCEYDKYAVQAYNAMYDTKELYYAKDIRAINPSDLPEADCWCAGIPCQAFSVAGKRRGFEDMRGTLVFEVFRLAAERHPRVLFLENVAGLLNHDGGRTFATILCGLWELGYDVQWQLLNSKNFGVPQNRERVFVVGYSGTGCRPEVFPIIEESNGYSTIGKSTETAIANTFTAGGHSGGNHSGMTMITVPVLTPDRPEKRQNGRRFKEDGEPMFTLTGQDRHGVMIKEATKQGYAIAEEGDSINFGIPNSKTRRGRVGKGIANTVDTGCQQGVVISGIYTQDSPRFNRGPLPGLSRALKSETHDASVTDGCRIRRLTPRECFRLQGFPDTYFDKAKAAGISDSQLYKMAGNAVTVNVIEAIARRLSC